MKPTGESNSFVLPPALLAEVEAAADAEHRPVADVVRAAIEGYVRKRQDRQVLRVGDLSDADLAAIAATEMDPRHDHLNAELE